MLIEYTLSKCQEKNIIVEEKKKKKKIGKEVIKRLNELIMMVIGI